MKKLNILLICGAGASSGFMAANIRKAAQAKSIDCTVLARSEAEVENYLQDLDILMIGPHLKYLLPELQERLNGTATKVALMDRSYYSLLDGESALNHILSLL